jgi:hypothetical protein
MQLYPVRMAIVSAAFPLKEQLNEFRRALRRRSLGELAAMISSGDAIWEFRPPEIERRKFDRSGKPVGEWEKYSDQIGAAMKGYLARAPQPAPEDPMMMRTEGVINRGLAMARPPLARGEYPPVTIPNLARGMANMDRFRGQGGRGGPGGRGGMASFKSRQLQNQAIDPWNASSPINTAEEPKKDEAKATPEKKDDETNVEEIDELSVPDFALLRFIDTTIEPGYIYQYKIKVKMRNPNFGKRNLAYPSVGRDEDIVAPEFTMTPKIEVPNETEWYVMDEKPDHDRLLVEVHRWVDGVLTNPDDPNSEKPIGDWSVLEKAQAHRGEYVGRIQNVMLPEWKVEKETYELAVNSKTNRPRIPVDFTTRSNAQVEEGVLLLDYAGGKGSSIQSGPKKNVDDIPVEALVLTPEGKLVVRSQPSDFKNTERETRAKSAKDWLVQVATGRAGNNNRRDLFNRQMIPGMEGGAGPRGRRTGG